MSVELKNIKMSVQEWIRLPDNPRQRDTERHARTAQRRHLSAGHLMQERVIAVGSKGKPMFKVDGHTRALLWDRGDLPLPRSGFVNVDLYDVSPPDDIVEIAKEYYVLPDNVNAAEGSADRISGALREHDVQLCSAAFSQSFGMALRLAHGGYSKITKDITEYEMVANFRDELLIADSWGLGRTLASIIATALAVIKNPRYDNEKLREFFQSLDNDEGQKMGKEVDAVQAMSDHIKKRRMSNTITGGANNADLMERCFTCINAYLDGRFMNCRQGVRRTSMANLFRENWNLM